MIKQKLWAAALALFVSGAATAQDVATITQAETTRILKTLSADDMQGRATFTPGIEKAADFIQGEFQRIGLQAFATIPAGKTDTFRQGFQMYRLTPGEAKVELNKKTVAPENMFLTSAHEKVNWKNDKKLAIVTIKEGENLRDAYRAADALEHDALVLVHPSHATTFANYQRNFSRGSMKREPGKGYSKLFVLTSETAPKKFSVSIKNNIETLPLANVVGVLEGKRKDEFVVFSGHYDHIGIRPAVDGDSIANGADDDASGITAMIQLAEYYKQQPQPERTLIFAAFTAEEIGGFGSRYFSEQLNPDQIVAMFNVEMIGKGSKFGPNSAYLTGFEKSDLGQLMQQRLQGTSYSIHPDPYLTQNLFYRSDNATLARLGVPAHTISSVQIDQDKTYHTVKDEFEMLDMEHMTNMVRAIALAAQGVVNGTDTPTRVDKAQVRQ